MKIRKMLVLPTFTFLIAVMNLCFVIFIVKDGIDEQQRSAFFVRETKPAFLIEQLHVPTSDFNNDSEEASLSRYAVYLEWKLVNVQKDGNYIVETYQEFEIYKDGKETKKIVATPNYQYLRYWNEY